MEAKRPQIEEREEAIRRRQQQQQEGIEYEQAPSPLSRQELPGKEGPIRSTLKQAMLWTQLFGTRLDGGGHRMPVHRTAS